MTSDLPTDFPTLADFLADAGLSEYLPEFQRLNLTVSSLAGASGEERGVIEVSMGFEPGHKLAFRHALEALSSNTASTTGCGWHGGGDEGSGEACEGGCEGLGDTLLHSSALSKVFAMVGELSSLHTLDLSDSYIGAAGASALESALGRDGVLLSLHTIDLCRNNIGAAGASAVASALGRDGVSLSLHTLNLSYNHIGAAGASALASALGRDGVSLSLHTLNLSTNRIGAEGAFALASALGRDGALPSLHTLNLCRSHICDIGASALSSALGHDGALPSLHTLNLMTNRIGAAGASALASVGSSKSRQKSMRWVSDVGAIGCSECPFNTLSDGASCVSFCPPSTYPRSSSGHTRTVCTLPYPTLPPWAATPPSPPTTHPNISSSFLPTLTAVRQSWSDAAVGVEWSGGEGSWGEVWVFVRSGWEEGDRVIGARVRVGEFDGLECSGCRAVEEWVGVVGKDGDVDWEFDRVGVRTIVLGNAWSDDAWGLADVALRAAGEDSGAIVFRVPLPEEVEGSVYAAAWRWVGDGGEGKDVEGVGGNKSANAVRAGGDVGMEGWSWSEVRFLGKGKVLQVSAGAVHTCAVRVGGKVGCWGDGSNGKLGYGNTDNIGDDELPSSSEAGDVEVGGEVVAMTAGTDHTCALLVGGKVRCWGNGIYGQLGYGNTNTIGDDELPSSVGDVDVGAEVVAITAGSDHTCALLVGGKVRCWGNGIYGQLGYGNTNTIGDDELPSSVGDVDVGAEVQAITAGSYHTCALLVGGKMRCWGRGEHGQLGYGNTDNIGDDELPSSSAAGDVDVGGEVVAITAGSYHTCALLVGGKMRCWGEGRYGRLGYGNTDNIGDDELPSSSEVGDVDVGGQVVSLAAGDAHTCAVLVGGKVRCWGDGDFGRLGYGDTNVIGDDSLPSSAGDVDVGGQVVSLAAGNAHTCAVLVGGKLRCWGFAGDGQLGYGNTNNIGDDEHPSSLWGKDANVDKDAYHYLQPTNEGVYLSSRSHIRFSDTLRPVKLTAGRYHTCALLLGGNVRCWGLGEDGQLGYGNTNNIGDDEDPSSVGAVDVGRKVIDIEAGRYHTCALLVGGKVRCWGRGEDGQLGYGNTNNIGATSLPTSVGDVNVGAEVQAITAGSYHTCALLVGGKVRCWGRGDDGQLGYGNTNTIGDDELPSSIGDVDVGGKVVAIAAGGYHTCALLTGGKVRCWGFAGDGQLGYGNTNNIGDDELPSSIVDVDVGGEVVAITAAVEHTCALLPGGKVRCWGYGKYGRLGYGNTNTIGDDEMPSSVGDVDVGGKVAAIAAGGYHTCAVLVGGKVRCWGDGIYGRLGYGGTSDIGDNELPSSVGAVDVGESVLSITLGRRHTCALLIDGNVRCWGAGVYGQLGYGNTNNIGDNENPSSVGVVDVSAMGSHLALDIDGVVVSTALSASSAPLLGISESMISPQPISALHFPTFSSPFPLSLEAWSTVDASPTSTDLCTFGSIVSASNTQVCTFSPPRGSVLAAGVILPANLKIISSPVIAIDTSSTMLFEGDLSLIAASGGVRKVLIGDRECSNPVINHNTSLLTCIAPPGMGVDVPVRVIPRSPSMIANTTLTISYEPPIIRSVSPPSEVSISLPTPLFLTGSNFGASGTRSGPLLRVVVGEEECGNAIIIDNNLLSCVAPPGVGKRSVQVISAGQGSNVVDIFPPTPSLHSATPPYMILGDSQRIVFEGSSLSSSVEVMDYVMVCGAVCSNLTILTPFTTFSCVLNSSQLSSWPSSTSSVDVSVAGIASESTDVFECIEAPFVSAVTALTTLPTMGGRKVRVIGGGFGENGDLSRVLFGSISLLPVPDVRWISRTELEVVTPPGAGVVEIVVESIAGVRSIVTNTSVVTYDSPIVTSTSPSYLLHGSPPTSITLRGSNFPPPTSPSSSLLITLGGNPCTSVSLHSTTEASCTLDPSNGFSSPLTSTVSTPPLLPTTTPFTPISTPTLLCNASSPLSRGTRVQLSGSGFGIDVGNKVRGLVREVWIGGERCGSLRVFGAFSLDCLVPVDAWEEGFEGSVKVKIVSAAGMESNECQMPVQVLEEQGWSPVGVAAWREVGLPTRLWVRWQVRETELRQLGDDGVFAVAVRGRDDESVLKSRIPVTASSTNGTSTGFLLFEAEVPVQEVAVDVWVRGEGVVMSSSSSPVGPVFESCDGNNFLLDILSLPWKKQVCIPCPVGAWCDQQSTSTSLRQRAGYYRLQGSEWESLHGVGFARCFLSSACVAESQTSLIHHPRDIALSNAGFPWPSTNLSSPSYSNSPCAPGHTGTLCAQCLPSTHYRDSAGRCIHCPTPGIQALLLTLLLLLNLTLFSAFLIVMISGVASDRENAYLKLVVAHAQVLTVVARIVKVQWPDAILDFFNSLAAMFLPGVSELSQCILGDAAHNPEVTASIRAIVTPFLLLLFAMLLWAKWDEFSAWCTRALRSSAATPSLARHISSAASLLDESGSRWGKWKRRMVATLAVTASLLHRPISEAGFTLLACVFVHPADIPPALGSAQDYRSLRLVENLDLACSDPGRSALAAVILIFGAFGIPMAFGALAWWHRKELSRDERDKTSWVWSRLGFVFEDYRTGFYFWGIVEMLWTVVLVLVTVSLSNAGAAVQFLAAAAISAVELALVTRYQPFEDRGENDFVTASSCMVVLTLLSGVLVDLQSDDAVASTPTFLVTISVLLVIGNSAVILFGLYKGLPVARITEKYVSRFCGRRCCRGKEKKKQKFVFGALERTRSTEVISNPMMVEEDDSEGARASRVRKASVFGDVNPLRESEEGKERVSVVLAPETTGESMPQQQTPPPPPPSPVPPSPSSSPSSSPSPSLDDEGEKSAPSASEDGQQQTGFTAEMS